MKIIKKHENQGLRRFMEQCRAEHEQVLEMTAETERKEREAAFAEHEERLAKEMTRLKQDEFKELKLRQRLREEAPELRDLATKLRAAYMQKELTAQLAEQEAAKIAQKVSFV